MKWYEQNINASERILNEKNCMNKAYADMILYLKAYKNVIF